MIYTLEEIAEVAAPILREYRVSRAYIFGSYARGEANEDSDVDLHVEISGDAQFGLFELSGLRMRLSDALGKNVDIMTEGAKKNAKPTFVRNLEGEEVPIFDARREELASAGTYR